MDLNRKFLVSNACMVLWDYCVLLCFFVFTEKINEILNGKNSEFDSIIVLVN